MGESGQRDGRKGGVGTKLWCVQLCFTHPNQIKSSQVKSIEGWVESTAMTFSMNRPQKFIEPFHVQAR